MKNILKNIVLGTIIWVLLTFKLLLSWRHVLFQSQYISFLHMSIEDGSCGVTQWCSSEQQGFQSETYPAFGGGTWEDTSTCIICHHNCLIVTKFRVDIHFQWGPKRTHWSFKVPFRDSSSTYHSTYHFEGPHIAPHRSRRARSCFLIRRVGQRSIAFDDEIPFSVIDWELSQEGNWGIYDSSTIAICGNCDVRVVIAVAPIMAMSMVKEIGFCHGFKILPPFTIYVHWNR